MNRISSESSAFPNARALQCKMSSIRKDPFNFNSQQDVPEILGVVLEELKGDSSLVENVFPITLRTTITCNTCFCSSINEDKSDANIQSDFFISKRKP